MGINLSVNKLLIYWECPQEEVIVDKINSTVKEKSPTFIIKP